MKNNFWKKVSQESKEKISLHFFLSFVSSSKETDKRLKWREQNVPTNLPIFGVVLMKRLRSSVSDLYIVSFIYLLPKNFLGSFILFLLGMFKSLLFGIYLPGLQLMHLSTCVQNCCQHPTHIWVLGLLSSLLPGDGGHNSCGSKRKGYSHEVDFSMQQRDPHTWTEALLL